MCFRFLYQFVIQLSWKIIHWGALFNPSLKALYQNRTLAWPEIPGSIEAKGKMLWMHCASLGEYEQGKSFLKAWKERHPADKVLVTFFSASGYEMVHPGAWVDYTAYLPWDTPKKVNQFLDYFQPDFVVFVKYEFWYNYLQELNKRRIPLIFISLILDKDHFLFKNYGAFMLKALKRVKHLFVQDQDSMQYLKNRGFTNLSLAGDTRIDTVADLPDSPYEDPLIESFVKRELPVVIVGSAWGEDIKLLSSLSIESLNKFHWVIAPHEIDESFISQIEKAFKALGVLKYSDQGVIGKEKVLIMDAVGHLRFLYRFARWVYVGGGFGNGIHNTLEPASYGKPVAFGPRYDKFREAVVLVQESSFFPVSVPGDLEKVIDLLSDEEQYRNISASIKAFIQANGKAVENILNIIEEF